MFEIPQGGTPSKKGSRAAHCSTARRLLSPNGVCRRPSAAAAVEHAVKNPVDILEKLAFVEKTEVEHIHEVADRRHMSRRPALSSKS
jgi:hypothetical protein